MRRAVDERLRPQVGDFRLFSRAAVIGAPRPARAASLRPRHGGLAGAERGDRPVPPPGPRRRGDQVPGVEDGAVRLDGDLVLLGPAAEAQPRRRAAADRLRPGLLGLGRLRDDRPEDDRPRLELAGLPPVALLGRDAHGDRPGGRLRGADLRGDQGPAALHHRRGDEPAGGHRAARAWDAARPRAPSAGSEFAAIVIVPIEEVSLGH